MSLTINLPTKAIITTGTTVRLGMLPLNVRTPPTFTVTVAAAGTNVNVATTAIALRGATTIAVSALSAALPNRAVIIFQNGVRARLTAAAASAATSVVVESLSADIPSTTAGTWNAGSLAIASMFVPVTPTLTDIDAGDVLIFPGNNRVTVTDFAPAGSTVLDVLPLTTAVTAGQTATTRGLMTLAGCTDATPTPQPKAVESTTYNSGIGNEQVMVAVKMTLKLGFNLVVGDRGADILSAIMYNAASYDREVWAEINRPSDGLYAGAAVITNASDTAAVQDIAKRTVDCQFQGTSFTYTKAA